MVRRFFLVAAMAVAVAGYALNMLPLLIAAALLLALALDGQEGSREPGVARGTYSLRRALDAVQARGWFALGAIAVGCSMAASWISARDEFSQTAYALWACALLLTLGAALLHDRVGRAAWQRAVAAVRRREVALEALAVAAMSALAFALRAFDLAHFPPPMHGDEGEMGMLALRVLAGKEPLALFGTYWLDHPSFFHYLQAASLLIFGQDEVGLRMLSAIFGTACVPVIYAVGRLGWGRIGALGAAWLMSVSGLHIQYSRIGLNNIESVFCMLLVMLLLALVYERSMPRLVVASVPEQPVRASDASPRAMLLPVLIGLVIGLSQYLYYGSRLIPVIATSLLFWLWRSRAINKRQLAVLFVALVVAFLPLGTYYLNHPPTFFNRMSGVSILRSENYRQELGRNAELPGDLLPLLGVQLERNLNFFVRGGDASSFYLQDIPAFDALTSILFWLGLGAALTRVRRYHELSLLVWFALGLFFAGILTNDAPNGPRLIVMVGSVYLLAGVFLARGARFLQLARRARARWLLVPAVAGALIVLLVNAQMYFGDYASKSANLAPIMVAREMIKYPQQDAYVLGAPNLYVEHGVIRFVARGVRAHNLPSVDDLPPPGDEGLLLIALADHVGDLQTAAAKLPGGQFTSFVDPIGRLVYVSYRIPPRGGY